VSNRCYLTTSDVERIYPGFQNPAFDEAESWVLCSAECVPLLWLPLFGDGDLATARFTTEEGEIDATAPLAKRVDAIEHLRGCAPFLDRLFADNGCIGGHLSLFVSFLSRCKGEYVTLQLDEIARLYPTEAEFDNLLRQCLAGIRYRRPNVREDIIALSTVMPERRFVPYEQLAVQGHQEDWWNFFRIMGESYLRNDVPWA